MQPSAERGTETQTSSLGHVPAKEKWEFDDGVTECFEDMLRRSIPQYDLMRDTVHNLAVRYLKHRTPLVDLGCSRGDAMARLVDKFGAHNQFIGVEVSKPMLETCRRRFRGMIDCGIVEIKDMDLRTGYPPHTASVTLCVLALQFTPINYRQQILRQAYEHTFSGGAFILVEKVLGASAHLDSVMVEEYHKMKRAAGYTADEIERKKMALEGVLVPVTAKWNEELLHGAGFREVDCVWRWQNFAAWLAVRS